MGVPRVLLAPGGHRRGSGPAGRRGGQGPRAAPGGGPAGRKADELTLSGGQIFVNGDERPSLGLAEVGRVAYLGIEPAAQEHRAGPRGASLLRPDPRRVRRRAQVVRIEIDQDTAELRILDWICVEDAGRIIHPLIVNGQIAGAVAQGIGGALYEHIVYDEDGNLSTGSLLDYLMPTSAEIPELVIGRVAYPAANPLGVRGVAKAHARPGRGAGRGVGDAVRHRGRPAADHARSLSRLMMRDHRAPHGAVTVIEIDRHDGATPGHGALATTCASPDRKALTGREAPGHRHHRDRIRALRRADLRAVYGAAFCDALYAMLAAAAEVPSRARRGQRPRHRRRASSPWPATCASRPRR